jgi:hypothetical protein
MKRRLSLLLAVGITLLAAASAGAATSPNPSQQCRAEQEDASFAASHAAKTFAQFYGTSKNEKNAFGTCVAGKAKAQAQGTEEAAAEKVPAAAKVSAKTTCKAERADDPAAFKAKHGTHKKKANALGKCISAAKSAAKAKAAATTVTATKVATTA